MPADISCISTGFSWYQLTSADFRLDPKVFRCSIFLKILNFLLLGFRLRKIKEIFHFTLTLVRTVMDAGTLKDAHTLKVARMLKDALTLINANFWMVAHGRSWTLRRSWTIVDVLGRSWTFSDDLGRLRNLVTRRLRDGHATFTRRSSDVHATFTRRSRDGRVHASKS